MVIRQKRIKIKYHALDILDEWIYALYDSTGNDESLEYTLRALVAELNKLKGLKNLLVYTPKLLNRNKKILESCAYCHGLHEYLPKILKTFGLN